jgi:uncharacterized membrane protein (UPF0127 family)
MGTRFFVYLLFFLSSISCAENLPRITVEAGGHILDCELANTPETISKGLMFRTELPKHEGMLFWMPYTYPWSFWMKNTPISLDILWLNSQKKVIYMVENAPPCQELNCPVYTPPSPADVLYVLEIGGGLAKSYHITLESQLYFDTTGTQS